VQVDRFARTPASRQAGRAALGLPRDACVVLSVAPLDAGKRLDYLLREIAALRRTDVYALFVGRQQPGTPALVAEGERLHPGRCRVLSLPF
jgi:hypothetical protein